MNQTTLLITCSSLLQFFFTNICTKFLTLFYLNKYLSILGNPDSLNGHSQQSLLNWLKWRHFLLFVNLLSNMGQVRRWAGGQGFRWASGQVSGWTGEQEDRLSRWAGGQMSRRAGGQVDQEGRWAGRHNTTSSDPNSSCLLFLQVVSMWINSQKLVKIVGVGRKQQEKFQINGNNFRLKITERHLLVNTPLMCASENTGRTTKL